MFNNPRKIWVWNDFIRCWLDKPPFFHPHKGEIEVNEYLLKTPILEQAGKTFKILEVIIDSTPTKEPIPRRFRVLARDHINLIKDKIKINKLKEANT